MSSALCISGVKKRRQNKGTGNIKDLFKERTWLNTLRSRGFVGLLFLDLFLVLFDVDEVEQWELLFLNSIGVDVDIDVLWT